MDSQHNFEKTPSKSLLNTVQTKLAQSTFNTKSPFPSIPPHSTPPSRCTKIKNPFESHLADRLHTHFFSPSVFKVSSPKVKEKFQWTIDEISSFYPADIDESATNQYETNEHDSMIESTAQAKIDMFFSEGVAPSPFNQQGRACPLISENETPAKQNNKKGCDVAAQTMLSLPIDLPEELENALKPYFNNSNCNNQFEENMSLHKKLFESEEIDSVAESIESSPAQSIILSPIAPPNQCDLDSRFHSPFKLDDCILSPLNVDPVINSPGRKPATKLNFSGYMSVDNSLNLVPDIVDQIPKNESVAFDSTQSSVREILSDSTVNWDMEYKHISADTPIKKREMDVSNSNTPRSKIFTSQRKKLSDSFLKEDEFKDKEANISIDECDIDEAWSISKTQDTQDITDAGYHTGLLLSDDMSWHHDVNLFASTPTKVKH